MYIQGVANFLDDFMGGLQLLGLAVIIGGLLWALVVLRLPRTVANGDDRGVSAAILRRCIALLGGGAFALAAFQALKLVTKAAVLTASLGELPWVAYAETLQFRAGVLRLLLALAIGVCARKLAHAPTRRGGWAILAVLALGVLISDAWLVHGVGRFEDRGLLMSVTVLHQFAAAAWVGGVIQLLGLWRLARHDAGALAFWPVALSRFSALGAGAVLVLVASGVTLAVKYVGAWAGMLGTGYGSLVTAKIFLLLVALGFAGLNFRAGRLWSQQGRADIALKRAPFYIEAEAFILVSLMFVAASLSSMPPAVDIRNLTASVPEVMEMFRPKMPSFASPSHDALIAGEAGRLAVIGRVPSAAATGWSDYNHNISGLFLFCMGVIALLSYLPAARRIKIANWARYWPAGFMLLGTFLFFRSDAESWPLGPIGFWQSTLGNGEVLQHRLATALAFTLGVLETNARRERPGLVSARNRERLRYMFPALCALGGILLVTHAHLPFEIKSDYLIQSTHLVMGLLATLMAAGRWLELRLATAGDTRRARVAGLVSITAMLMISGILLVYKEPLY